MSKIRMRVHAERVRPLVQKWVREREYSQGLNAEGQEHVVGGIPALAAEVGLSERAVGAISNGRQPSVAFDTLDKLLMHTGNHVLTWTSPEEGGFADYYNGQNWFSVPRGPKKKPRFCKCGKQMSRMSKGKLCFRCYNDEKRIERTCSDCGTTVDKHSTRCQPCYYKHKKISKQSQAWKERKAYLSKQMEGRFAISRAKKVT